MHTSVFNGGLLFGWCFALVGGVMLNPGAGLVGAGLLLIALTLLGARMAGLYGSAKPQTGEGA